MSTIETEADREARSELNRTGESGASGSEASADGHTRNHESEQSPSEAAVSHDHSTANEGLLPVDRTYDFDTSVPDTDEMPEYISQNGELDKILAEISTRERTGKRPRFLLSGPTQAGKTLLARYIAGVLGFPLITIQGGEGLNESDLLGSVVYVDDETRWVDGPLTKALLASQTRPVVVLFDEVNRTPARFKGLLYSALGDRCEVTIATRGGETIRGDPLNFITVATMNEGTGYFVEQLDLAERDRFGSKHPLDYLGRNRPEKEAGLIADRSPVDRSFAKELVAVANTIRDQADEVTSPVPIGVPTGTVIEWARTAVAYDAGDIDNPVVEAGRSTFVRPFCDDADAAEEAQTILTDHLDGGAVTTSDQRTAYGNGGENTDASANMGASTANGTTDAETQAGAGVIVCESDSCEFQTSTGNTDRVTALLDCPECGNDLILGGDA